MRSRALRCIYSCRTSVHLLLAGTFAGLLLLGRAPLLVAAEPPVPIQISAQQITAFDIDRPSRREFGALEFRGGLVLRSPYRHFGGLSAIRVAASGADFIALTDKGRWLRGRLLYEGSRPVGIDSAEMAPMLGPDGAPLAQRGWYDTESIAEDGGMLYVGIERVHQIVRFDYGRDGLLARGHPIPLPRATRSLPGNRGLEALAFVPKGWHLGGTLIAISERALDRGNNINAFLIGGPQPGSFAVRRSADYDITDAALLPAGDLLLLERRLNWSAGLGVRMRRIALEHISAGALVDGPVLLEADLGYEIDNMEALSVHRDATGETVLTLLSDDNFSIIQRTLLLQFALKER